MDTPGPDPRQPDGLEALFGRFLANPLPQPPPLAPSAAPPSAKPSAATSDLMKIVREALSDALTKPRRRHRCCTGPL